MIQDYLFMHHMNGQARRRRNFNESVHQNTLRVERWTRRIILWPKWLRCQCRRTRESYLPALLRCRNPKPGWRILGEVALLTAEWRCIPFHYLRYGLFESSVSLAGARSFLPETVMYYRVLPRWNTSCLLLDDKLVFKSILRGASIRQPKELLHIINGLVIDSSHEVVGHSEQLMAMLAGCSIPLVLKPTDFGSGGNAIRVFRLEDGIWVDKNGTTLNFRFLCEIDGRWILEEYVNQHPVLAAPHPSSVNTLRVITYHDPVSGVIDVLYCMLKVGAGGRETDNAHTDGVYLAVDRDTGRVASMAYDENLRVHGIHPTTGFVFSKLGTAPNFDAVKAVAERCARAFPDLRMIGWDIAVDADDRPIVIEGNSSPGLTIIQRTHGGMRAVVMERWRR